MNSFERINRALARQQTDYVPIMLHNFMPAAREAGMTMKEFRSKPENMARAFVEASRKYDLDGVLTDMDTALEACAMGAKTEFPDDLPAKVTAPIQTAFATSLSQREKGHDAVRDERERDIAEVIEQVDPKKLQSDERVQIYLEAIRLIRREIGGELFLRGNADQGPFSLAAAVLGLTETMTVMLDESKTELLLQLIERCYDVHFAFHLMVKEAGADATSFGDSMGSPDLISPKLYRKFVAPFQRRLAQDLSQHGIKTICHVCGKTDLILESLAESGFAGYEIDYKTNIPKARQVMNGKSVLFGILDPSGVFCLGTKSAIVTATTELLDLFSDGGLVIGAGCALPAETPSENITAFVKTVRNRQLL